MMEKPMRNQTRGFMLVVCLLGLLFCFPGCGKRADDKAGAPPLQEQDQSKTVEQTVGDLETAPRLGLMLNQLSEIDTYPGWPILVELGIWHPRLYRPEANAEPMAIASSGKSWAEAISLSVKGYADRTMGLAWKWMPLKEGPLTLDAKNQGALRWWLAAEDTETLQEGDYRIVATLDTRGVKKPGTWRGRIDSEPAVFHLKKEPSPLTEEQAEEKLLLLAACARDLGQDDKATRYINELLVSQPESIQGLAFQGDQLEESGDKAGAMRAYEKAIRIFNREYPLAEPPRDLYKNYNRLLLELLKKRKN
jgi:tetratricopeptide (TPR) repeat protein